nr:conjugal transfer protein TraN [Duganella vulcania]
MNATPLIANLNQAALLQRLSQIQLASIAAAFSVASVGLLPGVSRAADRGIADGQATATSSLGAFALPAISGGDPGATITLKNGAMAGKTLSSDQLAPGAKPGFIDSAAAATSGGKAAVVDQDNSARSVGQTEGSHWGNAYQTINGSALTRALYDYDAHGDTFLNNSAVIASNVNANGSGSGYSGCIVTPTSATPTTTVLTNTYKTTCDRNVPVTACASNRNQDGSVSSNPDSCNSTDACAAYDVAGFAPAGCTPGTTFSNQSTFVGNTYGSGQRNGVLVEHICSSGGFQVRVSNAHTVSGGGGPYEFWINAANGAPSYFDMPGLWGTDATNNQSYSGATLTATNCSSDGSSCDLTVTVHTLTPSAGNASGTVHFADDPTPIEAKMTTAAWTCTSASRVAVIGGVRIGAGSAESASVPSLFAGEDHTKGFCLAATAKNFKCHCDQTGSNCAPASTCGTVQSDSACSYVSSRCNIGTDSNCIKWEDTYSCTNGTSTVQNPSPTNGNTVTCPGAVRCMGTDCVVPHDESNGDFNTVASALGLATGIAMDSSCSAQGSCKVFGGTQMACSYSAFGFYNCCSVNPPTVNIADWVRLGYTTWNLVQRSHTLASAGSSIGTPSETGQWSEVSRQTAQVVDDWVYKPISSAIDTVKSTWTVGSSAAPATEAQVTSSLETASGVSTWATMQSDMCKQAINFADELGIDHSVLTGQGGLFTEGENGLTTLNWAGNSQLAMLSEIFFWLQVITWALIIYQIIFFDCSDQGAYQLAANKKLNLCVYTGEYCSSKVSFGFIKVCTQYTKSYCCYNSILARIVNEQGRPQIGKSWGGGEHPDCSGFSADQLSALDFTAMDLTEYFNSLNVAGVAPANVLANLNATTGTSVYTGGTASSGSSSSADAITRFNATGMNGSNTEVGNKDLSNTLSNSMRSGAVAPTH